MFLLSRQVHARGKPLATALDLGIIAKRTTGFSGASLANLLNEAAIVAARNDKVHQCSLFRGSQIILILGAGRGT